MTGGTEAEGFTGPDPLLAMMAKAEVMVPESAVAEAVAAERERIASRPFVLVWRDERGTEICRSTPVMPGTAKIGIPLDAQSADLITEDVTL